MATTTSSTRQEISRRKSSKGVEGRGRGRWRGGADTGLSLHRAVCELLNITVKYRVAADTLRASRREQRELLSQPLLYIRARGWKGRGWPASMHPIIRLSRPSLIDATDVARLGKTSQPFPNGAFHPNTFTKHSIECWYLSKNDAMRWLGWIKEDWIWILLLLFLVSFT